ncbi:MAG TPA: glycosyltransferase [Chitinophagaceae bacterium]
MILTFLKLHVWEITFFLLALVTLVQLFYYLFFFSRVSFYKPIIKTKSQEHPVSVVICARDEDEKLARNLPGVLVQTYPTTHEVVLINDNSVDDTKYVLEELKKTFKSLHIVELKQEAIHITGKKYPLSIGIRECKYEIVLLTDADCVPASEFWIQKMQEGYNENTEVVLGYGAYNKLPGLLNKIIRFETFHTGIQYLSYALAGMPYMGVGRNLSYKKELFFRNKGFSSINHIPSGDDDLFINQVATKYNTSVVLDKDAITLSSPKKTWKEWWNQKSRHYTTAKYYKPLHKFSLGLYSLTQFLFYPLFIACAFLFDWRLALACLVIRLLVQGVIFYKAMQKMNEKDLWPLFIFFDLWMIIYYTLFLPALWKKPKRTWN